jgi:hypothetical protein
MFGCWEMGRRSVVGWYDDFMYNFFARESWESVVGEAACMCIYQRQRVDRYDEIIHSYLYIIL